MSGQDYTLSRDIREAYMENLPFPKLSSAAAAPAAASNLRSSRFRDYLYDCLEVVELELQPGQVSSFMVFRLGDTQPEGGGVPQGEYPQRQYHFSGVLPQNLRSAADTSGISTIIKMLEDLHASQDDFQEGVDLEMQPVDSGIMSRDVWDELVRLLKDRDVRDELVRLLKDSALLSAQQGGAVAVAHICPTAQPQSQQARWALQRRLHTQLRRLRNLRNNPTWLSEMLKPAFPGVGAAATSFPASGASAYVLGVQYNVSNPLAQLPAGGTQQSAVHSNKFPKNLPYEGVEATEDVRLDVNDEDGGSQPPQRSAEGSQQSGPDGAKASKLQMTIILALLAATMGSTGFTITRLHSRPAAARVLTRVAIPFECGALAVALIYIFLRMRVQDTVAAAACPAPGHPSTTMTWFVYIGWILWGISVSVTLAAHIV